MPIHIGRPVTVESYAFPYDRVFDALVAMLPTLGFSIDAKDRSGGVITAGGGSATPPREPVPIQVKRAGDNSTVVLVTLGQPDDPGKGILAGLTAYLQNSGTPQAAASAAAAAAMHAPSGAPLRLLARIAVALVILTLLLTFLVLRK